jgi:hypothetical protein
MKILYLESDDCFLCLLMSQFEKDLLKEQKIKKYIAEKQKIESLEIMMAMMIEIFESYNDLDQNESFEIIENSFSVSFFS